MKRLLYLLLLLPLLVQAAPVYTEAVWTVYTTSTGKPLIVGGKPVTGTSLAECAAKWPQGDGKFYACYNYTRGTNPSPPPVVAKPAAPSGLAVVAGNGQATVTWTARAGATSYQVYVNDVHSAPDVTTTTRVVVGLTNGAAYTVRVSARNGAGYGPWGAALSVTPVGPVVPPVVPPVVDGRPDYTTTDAVQPGWMPGAYQVGQVGRLDLGLPSGNPSTNGYAYELYRNGTLYFSASNQPRFVDVPFSSLDADASISFSATASNAKGTSPPVEGSPVVVAVEVMPQALTINDKQVILLRFALGLPRESLVRRQIRLLHTEVTRDRATKDDAFIHRWIKWTGA